MSRGITVKAGILSVILPLVLTACTDPNDPRFYHAAPNTTPESAAHLIMGAPDTGFLGIGRTTIRAIAVDGKGVSSEYNVAPMFDAPPLPLAPGTHAILFRAFSDPVAAYVCTNIMFEQGKTYIARTTELDIDSTTIWLEDNATGQLVGQKYAAATFREPLMLMSGVVFQAIFAHPLPPCPAPVEAK